MQHAVPAAGDGDMRGEVLHFDEGQGFGYISGADGNPYTFRREDLRRQVPIAKGMSVEFEGSAGQARNVFLIHDLAAATQSAAAPSPWPAAVAPPAVPAVGSQQFGRDGHLDGTPSMGLWSYFWNCLTTNYVTFRGRARRKEYWGYFLFWTISMVVIMGAGLFLDAAGGRLGNDMPIASVSAFGLFMLATLLPSLAVTVRRIHDIGLSGWFYLLVLVPYVGSLIVFVFSLIPTQTYPNKWGPVPAGIRIPPPYMPTPTPPAT